MKIKATGGGDFAPIEAGNHVAICNSVIDLGVQPGRGKFNTPRREIYINFELPTETEERDGKTEPRMIGRRFTASMSRKANLRKFIESWFGKPFPSDDAAGDFDLQKLLGRKCLLNVTHATRGDKTYANINGATPIPKGMQSDYSQHFESYYYSLGNPDAAMFNKFPEWLQKVIYDRVKTVPAAEPSRSADELQEQTKEDGGVPF